VLRKAVLLASVQQIFAADPVLAEVGFGRYVKKRALEPLQNYVLPLLAAKSELKRAGIVAGKDLDAARSLLREGSLSSLRINARAIGEYAERLETSSDAPALINNINRSVEKFDSYLLRASRDEEEKRDTTEFISASLSAIDELLGTVPQDVMNDVTGQSTDSRS